MSEIKFKTIISILTLTQKGLSVNEIFLISKINLNEWNNLLAVFKTFLMKYKGLWKINNEVFKAIVTKKYLQDSKIVKKLHSDIADTIEKTTNSIRANLSSIHKQIIFQIKGSSFKYRKFLVIVQSK